MLQVLDDGRLTDGHGRTVDFTNTVVVMTQRGQSDDSELAPQDADEDKIVDAVQAALRAKFLPEFLNRIDEIVLFQPLVKDEVRSIVKLQIQSPGNEPKTMASSWKLPSRRSMRSLWLVVPHMVLDR